ncbi:MAG: winged helix-turn-helix domain-containing protein [Candidatus Anstonellaceae archaeon]
MIAAIFLLFASVTSTSYIAYFSDESSAAVQEISYQGSFGNYTVMVSANPITVQVFGPQATETALVEEILLLKRKGILATACVPKAEGFRMYYCSPEGQWMGCLDESCAGLQQRTAVVFVQKKAEPRQEKEFDVLPIIAGLILIFAIAFALLQKPQRAFESGTKAEILRQLFEADRIPTDLSARLGKSKSTITEHLEELVREGMVERIERPGKKFVFYRLTSKGRQLLLRKAG